MTPTELLSLAHWYNSDQARFSLDFPLFGRAVEFHVLTSAPHVIAGRSVETVNQVLALDAADLVRAVEVVWDNYMLNMSTTGYGLEVREGQTETEANMDDFGIHDAAKAWSLTDLKYVLIAELDHEDYAANYAYLFMDNEWETHGVSIVVRNGRVVGGGESGIWIGQFEPKASGG